MSKVLVKEKVKELTDPNEEIIEKVTNLVKEHVSALEKVVKGKRKREDATPQVQKCRFSIKRARILTAHESLVALEYSKELSLMESMKVDELRSTMQEKLNFTEDELKKQKSNSTTFKTKKELLEMVKKHYDSMWEQWVAECEEAIERNLVQAPQLFTRHQTPTTDKERS